MAKKLLVGGYDFNAPESSINIKGNYAKEKFLLITNVEDNKIIYNFVNLLKRSFFIFSFLIRFSTFFINLSRIPSVNFTFDTYNLQLNRLIYLDNKYKKSWF